MTCFNKILALPAGLLFCLSLPCFSAPPDGAGSGNAKAPGLAKKKQSSDDSKSGVVQEEEGDESESESGESYRTESQESDDSYAHQSEAFQQSASLYSMGAVISLGDGNTNAAIVGFTQSFTQFKSAENLKNSDPLTKTGVDAKIAPLDNGFLRQGEANALGQAFESRTGMSRDRFPSYARSMAMGKIGLSDFIGEIPNENYRAQLESGYSQIPDDLKSAFAAKENSTENETYLVKLNAYTKEKGLGAEAALANSAAGVPSFPVSSPAPPQESPAPSAPVAQAWTGASRQQEGGARNLASPAPKLQAVANARPVANQGEKEKLEKLTPLANSFGDMNSTGQLENSIFELVSSKYRAIGPRFALPRHGAR